MSTAVLAHSRPAWIGFAQFLAIYTMLADHLAAWFGMGILGDAIRLSIGRVAFPMFAFLVAWQALRSSDAERYALRILVIAALAQLPFMALHGHVLGNICFTLSAGAAWIAYGRNRYLPALALAVLLTAATPWIEYGSAGLLLVISFALAMRYPPAWLIPLLVWPATHYGFSIMALGAATGVLIVAWLYSTPPWLSVVSLPRWLTRWFYPVHLWVLVLARWIT